MRVITHPKADQELEEAVFYYEISSPGFGDRFLNEFTKTISRIVEAPERWRIIQGNVRKLNLKRFPYAVVYETRQESIYVIAVMHLRRQPFYWINRVK